MENKIIKNTWLSILFIFMIIAAWYINYNLICIVINKVSPTAYYMQASDDMFEEDVYFSAMTEEKTGILSDLCEGIAGFEEAMKGENYEYRVFMDEHIDEVMGIAGKNDKYIRYLNSIESSLQNLEGYIRNMAQFEKMIASLAMYISLLFVICIFLFGFDGRMAFYIVTALIYCITVASAFSKGLSDYPLAACFSFLAKLSNDTFTYSDMKILKLYFMQELKEALMTVVIFDTIQQIYQNKKEHSFLKDVYYVLQSLDVQVAYLRNHNHSSSKYIARLIKFSGSIEGECQKKEKKIKKRIKRLSRRLAFWKKVVVKLESKVRKHMEDNKKELEIQRENTERLRENLKLIRTNTEVEYSAEEYIKLLEETKLLMIELGYSSR